MILISDLLHIAISITSVLDFFSAHDILNILRGNHSSAASSLHSVPSTHIRRKQLPKQCINFGVHGNVSTCKYGFHFPETFLSHRKSFLYFNVTLCILCYGISQIFEAFHLRYFYTITIYVTKWCIGFFLR